MFFQQHFAEWIGVENIFEVSGRVPGIGKLNFFNTSLRNINNPVTAAFRQQFIRCVPENVIVFNLGDAFRIHIQRAMPKLIVEPLEREHIIMIVVSKFLNIT